MTDQKAPRVIFVDGFNTVGKDHFISELCRLLPGKVRVTDPRVWLPVFQNSRRYWDFIFRVSEENDAIFRAHVHQLRSIEGKLQDIFSSDSIIVSNRSILTAVNYNFIPAEYLDRKIGGDDAVRQEYIKTYDHLIKTVFPDTPMLMVNLNAFHGEKKDLTLSQCIHELRARMHEREPNLLMNDFYLSYLIQAYKFPLQEVKDIFTHWEDATSDDAELIINKYFQ